MRSLENELIAGLTQFHIEDRDIRSLTIFCNPNFIRGADYEIIEKIHTLLSKWMEQEIVKKELSPNKREVYTFIGQQENHAKKHGVLKYNYDDMVIEE